MRSCLKKIVTGCAAVCVIFAILGIALAAYLVLLHHRSLVLPVPTGPYAVGRTAYDWVDGDRSDSLADLPGEKRELLVWIWYPADGSGQDRPAPYVPPAWVKAHNADAGIGKYVESDYLNIQTHSFAHAFLLGSESAYPVIIMQPGMGPVPADYTTFAENLAGHGYIVAGINETHTSNMIVFPDGRVVPRTEKGTIPDSAGLDQIDADAGRIGRVWTEDAIFVIDQLQSLNADPASPFHNRLDLAHLGLFGHSFGGATAASVCKLDRRCKAGADLDGTLFSYHAGGTLHAAFMFMAEDACGKDCDTMLANFSTRRQTYIIFRSTGHAISTLATCLCVCYRQRGQYLKRRDISGPFLRREEWKSPMSTL